MCDFLMIFLRFSYEFLMIFQDFLHFWQESLFFVVISRFTSYKIMEPIGILHGFLHSLIVLVRWYCFYTRVGDQNWKKSSDFP